MLAGFIVVVILSVGTDMALVAAGIFPPLIQPALFTTRLLLLATTYRTAYSVGGSYLAARLAPDRPMAHAVALGIVGLLVSSAGAIVMRGGGPIWYPITLIVLAMPCSWLGGALYRMTRAGR